jgi:hypothetical protein
VRTKAAYRGTASLIGRAGGSINAGFAYGKSALDAIEGFGRRVAFLKVDPVNATANVKNGYGFYKMSVDNL